MPGGRWGVNAFYCFDAFSLREPVSTSLENALSIPFRPEAEIGEPALGASHPGDLMHLLVRQREVEDVNIFRQPFDPRGSRYCRNPLLHKPAQANLRGTLAVALPDPRPCLVVLGTD